MLNYPCKSIIFQMKKIAMLTKAHNKAVPKKLLTVSNFQPNIKKMICGVYLHCYTFWFVLHLRTVFIEMSLVSPFGTWSTWRGLCHFSWLLIPSIRILIFTIKKIIISFLHRAHEDRTACHFWRMGFIEVVDTYRSDGARQKQPCQWEKKSQIHSLTKVIINFYQLIYLYECNIPWAVLFYDWTTDADGDNIELYWELYNIMYQYLSQGTLLMLSI